MGLELRPRRTPPWVELLVCSASGGREDDRFSGVVWLDESGRTTDRRNNPGMVD